MAVPTTYFTSTKNVSGMFEKIRQAGVPDRFSHTFLKQLGFTSSSDRPIIPMLRALGFIDDSGTPTDRYRRYKDKPRAPQVMAEAIREAYADLFTLDQSAQSSSHEDLKGMFARLSDKGDDIAGKMAGSFEALAALADFSSPEEESPPPDDEEAEDSLPGDDALPPPPPGELGVLQLRHDIHVHLPITTEIEVYHAIFRSIRENLS